MYPNYYNMYDPYYNFDNEVRHMDKEAENEELITLNEAIELIKKSVEDEKEDELFYNILIEQAKAEKEKSIIRNIQEDEKKHNHILKRLYYEFTGQMLPEATLKNNGAQNMNMDYKSNLEKALFGELDAVSKYRKIMGAMPNGNSYTLLMSIMTDELRHANKYNYLIHHAG